MSTSLLNLGMIKTVVSNNATLTKRRPLPSLALCLIMDAIGCLSYIIPALGELSDVVWAPISAIIFYFMFGKKLGVIGGIVDFLEELSPGLDFIPSFTIGWLLRKKNIL